MLDRGVDGVRQTILAECIRCLLVNPFGPFVVLDHNWRLFKLLLRFNVLVYIRSLCYGGLLLFFGSFLCSLFLWQYWFQQWFFCMYFFGFNVHHGIISDKNQSFTLHMIIPWTAALIWVLSILNKRFALLIPSFSETLVLRSDWLVILGNHQCDLFGLGVLTDRVLAVLEDLCVPLHDRPGASVVLEQRIRYP
jgi:hypothetical protein